MGVLKARVKCNTDKHEPFIHKGEIKEAIRATDDLKGWFWGIFMPEEVMDEEGVYGFPSGDFEVIEYIE